MKSMQPTVRYVNWRDGHPLYFESAWSVLHKFCALNSANAQTCLRHFGRAGKRKDGSRCISSYATDLRFKGNIDFNKFSEAVGCDLGWLEQAMVEGWGVRKELMKRTASFLRYCPKCIDQGFHTVLFQFTDEKQCPLHEELLQDFCPKCGKHIPYKLPVGKSEPYCCSCGFKLWWNVRENDWPEIQDADEQAWILSQQARSIRLRHGLVPAAELPRSVSMREEANLSFHEWLDRRKQEQVEPHDAGTVVLRRVWEPPARVCSQVLNRDAQSVASANSSKNFSDQAVRLLRRIEDQILRQFPKKMRTRMLGRAGKIRDLNALETFEWPVGFKSYLIWRSYWFGAFQNNRKRSGGGVLGSAVEAQLQARVTWRFAQHSRLIRFSKRVGPETDWAQLHVFSMAASQTFRAARLMAGETLVAASYFRGNRCPFLEGVVLPFTLLARGTGGAFELIVKSRESIVFKDTANFAGDVMRSERGRAEKTGDLFEVQSSKISQ